MSKKLLLSIGAVILVIGVAIGVTYAYFTSDTSAANVVTIGNVKISARLGNRVLNADGIRTGEPFDVDPVVISNNGSTHAYLRLRLMPENKNDLQYYENLEIYDPNDPAGNNIQSLSKDDDGDWYHYRIRLDTRGQVTLAGRATLKEGVAGQLSEVKVRYYVEAIQADHIEIINGYPNWPNVEIKPYNG